MAKKRPNPADFRFEQKSGETLIREPGQIAPYDFSIDTLDRCVVYLMDKIAQVTVDRVANSRLHFGPVEGSIFLRDCENSVVTACCGQFRLKNCKNLYIFLYCDSDPSIEYSSGLIFGPYNFSYPLQDQHFAQAKLDNNHDLWSQVFDFNKSEDEHWRIMRPEEFKLLNWEKPELGEPVNPVPRHVLYGGSLTEDIKVGSQQHGEQGLMSFGFETTQNEAELLVDSDQTGPAPDRHGYLISDDIDFAGPASSDPFAQPAEHQAGPEDLEELERQRQRDNENKERNKRMMYKDEKERQKKDEKRAKAREELKRWAAEREKQIQRRRELNLQNEKVLMEKQKNSSSSWKRIGSMIESDDRKDQARMRSVLIARKHEN
jgi:hypothetical protein